MSTVLDAQHSDSVVGGESLPQSEEARARRFCQTFVASLAVLLMGAAVVNFVVDPFAQYLPRLFPPIIQMSRVDKLALFEQLGDAPSDIPQGLVLGSSRVLKLEPSYLRERTGRRFFNAGVNYAVPIDHLAWYRYFTASYDRAPEIVVVGLDLSSFSPHVATDARLVSNPTLSKQVREHLSRKDRWRWRELLSWQQTRESLRSLKHHLGGGETPEPIEEYRPDGLLVYLQRERQLAEGTYDFDGPLEFNKHEYAVRYRGFDQLNEQRLAEFEALVKECTTRGTQLQVFLTPLHPDMLSHLLGCTELAARRIELIAYLEQRAAECGFTFADFTEIDSYGGDAALFVDGIHQLEPNTRKLIDAVVDQLSAEGSLGGEG